MEDFFEGLIILLIIILSLLVLIIITCGPIIALGFVIKMIMG